MGNRKGSLWKNWVWKGCVICKTTDPSEFNKNKAMRSGLQTECRSCHDLTPSRKVPEQYFLLKKKQNGLCAICHKLPRRRRLQIDHDHTCCPPNEFCDKCIRGLLCEQCNHALGLFYDNPEILQNAILYLAAFKVSRN